MLLRRIKESCYHYFYNISPKLPYTRLNIVCREIRRMSSSGTILDLGCGDGTAMALILSNTSGKYQVTGLDAYAPAIAQAKELGIYSDMVVSDVSHLSLKDKAFDVVILLEVLEHMPRDAGNNLLDQIEAVAKKGIVVSTPGYLDRLRRGTESEDTAYYVSLHKNEPYKIPHITIWTPSEYARKGYKVLRVNGLYVNRLPYFLVQIFSVLSAPFTYLFPWGTANHLVAVKRVKDNAA